MVRTDLWNGTVSWSAYRTQATDILNIAAELPTNSVPHRAIMYTPAVTIVAAWISALTGVGPSIASGSQT